VAIPGASSGTINLSWSAPVEPVDYYNVYRGTTSCGEAKVGTSITTSYTDADLTLLPVTTYYYCVTAVNSGGESATSLEVSSQTSP
jgi:fibronectin type 3 domain-containing protein